MDVARGGIHVRGVRTPEGHLQHAVMMDTNLAASLSLHGLTEADAQARLEADGYNELPRANRRTAPRIVLEVLREPMLALFVGRCDPSRPGRSERSDHPAA